MEFGHLEGEYPQLGDLLTIVINSGEFLESNEYLDLFFFDKIDPMATHYFHAYLFLFLFGNVFQST